MIIKCIFITKLNDKMLTIFRGTCFPEAPVISSRQEYEGKAMMDFISKYKFYLAFENAHMCKDYITEKLHKNSFLSGTVPIIYGARKVVLFIFLISLVLLNKLF